MWAWVLAVTQTDILARQPILTFSINSIGHVETPPVPHGHCSRREKAARPHRPPKRIKYMRRTTSLQRDARAKVNDDDQMGPLPGHLEVLSGLQARSLIGTRYADFIRASGYRHRAQRPDT
jgi:hypothetical protein